MYRDSKLENPLEVGEKYQDRVARVVLEKYGYEIHFYKSKHDQYTIGESVEGFEVKYDSWIGKSQRLSIEVGEKTRKSLEAFTKSGIFRDDNTKWYCQGDDNFCWIFSKKKLRAYFCDNNPNVIDNNPPTIQKFYIDVATADRLCSKKIAL